MPDPQIHDAKQGQVNDARVRMHYLNESGEAHTLVMTCSEGLESKTMAADILRAMFSEACQRLNYQMLSLQLEVSTSGLAVLHEGQGERAELSVGKSSVVRFPKTYLPGLE